MQRKNNKNDIFEVKQQLLNILFKDVDREHCELDSYIASYLIRKKDREQIDNEVLEFLENTKEKLIDIYNKREILFLRKYSYEKILNAYLLDKYKIEKMEIGYSIFESNEEKNDLIEKQLKNEEQKEEIKEKKRSSDEEWKKYLIEEWDKTFAKFKLERNNTGKIVKNSYRTKLADSYKVSVSSVYEIEEKIKKNCHGKTCTCIRENMGCEPSYIGCNYYNEFKLMLMKKSKNENKPMRSKKTVHKKVQQNKKKKSMDSESKKQQNNVEKKQQMRIKAKDFVVRGNIFKCMHNEHKIRDIDATVKVINNEDVINNIQIPAGYCKRCKIFFIMDSVYEKLKGKGIILCRISDEKTYMKNIVGNSMKLSKESVLMQYGYTVSKTENLSSIKRKKILATIIDNQVLSKNEIIGYLDFFINQRKGQIKFEKAITKWNEDKEFVEKYKAGRYLKYGVKGISRT